jgi:hypothetical protein
MRIYNKITTGVLKKEKGESSDFERKGEIKMLMENIDKFRGGNLTAMRS